MKPVNYFSSKRMAKMFIEQASIDDESTTVSVDYTPSISELARANALLDHNKNSIFLDVTSSLTSKTATEKAASSYDTDFWLSLPLSWPSVLELMREVSVILRKYKTNIPDSWLKLSDLDISSLEDSNQPEDSELINTVERRNAENV